MFKVNNKNKNDVVDVGSGVFIVNFEHISTHFSSVSDVEFEHVFVF